MEHSSPSPIDFATAPAPNLHAVLAQMREEGPVVLGRLHGKPAWIITRHEELRAAFKNEAHFHSAAIQEPLVGQTMQSMIGHEHRRNRGLISFAFIPSAIAEISRTLVEPVAHELLSEVGSEREFDLISAFTRRFPAAVITRMLGIPVHDEKQFLDWAIKLFQFPWDPMGARLAWKHFTNYLKPILKQRRSEPGEDLLSILIRAEAEGQRLTDAEILSFIGILYPAGSDTAFKSMGSMMFGVLTHPDVRDAALAEPAIRSRIAEEAMRWEPPVALLPRRANIDSKIGGVDIQSGSQVVFAIAAANRDPRVFDRPNAFDPWRPRLKESLAFGHGPHVCLGAELAREEMKVGLGAMLERFPQMTLVDADSVEVLGSILRGPRALRVRVRN
ncbi:MAG: cytochrome P450 [Deltaproteobacteria bacterium]|nr:cytochrome P450 [Deltaproteobacteria bacterium]